MKTFPPNPADGAIFQAEANIYYKYNKAMNSWLRLDDSMFISLATPTIDGLMSKEDYQKFLQILTNPPKTSLTSPGCKEIIFNAGVFGIRSSKTHLIVEHNLAIMGIEAIKELPWQIHENTYGINFKVNLPLLVNILINSGNIKFNTTQGEQGDQGPDGDPGIDYLDTGPVGIQGKPGQNAVYPGNLSLDTISGDIGDGTRGIVDISIEEISPTENYLVLTRGVVADNGYFPDYVTVIISIRNGY